MRRTPRAPSGPPIWKRVLRWAGYVLLTLAITIVGAHLYASWTRAEPSISLEMDSATIVSPTAPGVDDLKIVFGEESVSAAYTVTYSLANDGDTYLEAGHFEPPLAVTGPSGHCRIVAVADSRSRATLQFAVRQPSENRIVFEPTAMEPGDWVRVNFVLVATDLYRPVIEHVVPPPDDQPDWDLTIEYDGPPRPVQPADLVVGGHVRGIGDIAPLQRAWQAPSTGDESTSSSLSPVWTAVGLATVLMVYVAFLLSYSSTRSTRRARRAEPDDD